MNNRLKHLIFKNFFIKNLNVYVIPGVLTCDNDMEICLFSV